MRVLIKKKIHSCHFLNQTFNLLCRYVNLVQDLQRVDILALSANEQLAFFLNLYNAMIIHAVIRIGWREGAIDRRAFYGDFNYIIGGYPYSLTAIKNGILRSNQRQPYSLTKPFPAGDRRLEVPHFNSKAIQSLVLQSWYGIPHVQNQNWSLFFLAGIIGLLLHHVSIDSILNIKISAIYTCIFLYAGDSTPHKNASLTAIL